MQHKVDDLHFDWVSSIVILISFSFWWLGGGAHGT